ncbi:MAG: thioredoxin family protein [Acidobacteriota bacterium]|nr:MAG: thioredoxin family protein [Acidobacteriota bacterium]
MKTQTKMLFLALTLSALVAAGSPLLAGGAHSYSAEAVQKAQDDGQVVVLEFHASWCGTCRKQASTLARLSQDLMQHNVAVFKVDYDKASALKKEHKVARQSTLIVLKDGKEVARAIGLTDEDDIRALIGRAL